MKFEKNQIKKEGGITLIALIITIIVLVILAAVSIKNVYDSKIVGYATNGATAYASSANEENNILDQTTLIIESAVDKIDRVLGNKQLITPVMTVITGTKGENDIYTSDVIVKIENLESDENAENMKIHYEISGAEEQMTEE